MIKYHADTTWNGTATHAHINIKWFWDAAEMKHHVNRTCFHAGLKSQTGQGCFVLKINRRGNTTAWNIWLNNWCFLIMLTDNLVMQTGIPASKTAKMSHNLLSSAKLVETP